MESFLACDKDAFAFRDTKKTNNNNPLVILEKAIFIIACVLHGKNILIYFSLQRKHFPCYVNDHFKVKKGEF